MPPPELHFTPNNMLTLARKYSFYPADEADDADGYAASPRTGLSGKYAGFHHLLVGDPQKVVYITVERQARASDGVRRAADFFVNASLADTTGKGTLAYFLPWDEKGAAVEMTIPRFALGDDASANPPIFFTAVLSGCSIIFKGSAGKPTIYHCGTAGGGKGASTKGDSNEFFRKMIGKIDTQGLGRAKKTIGAQVLSSDYMTLTGSPGTAPAHQAQFEKKLKTHYDKQLVIADVNMWGTVFGFRRGTDWEFYLQENATITYCRVEDIVEAIGKKKFGLFGKKQLDVDNLTLADAYRSGVRQIQHARPAVVTEVFPGAGHATVLSRWKTLRL